MGPGISFVLCLIYYGFSLHFGCTQTKYHSLPNIHHQQPITKSPGILKHNNTTCFVGANKVSPSKFSDYCHPSYQVRLVHSCLPAILGPQNSCLPIPPVSTSPLSFWKRSGLMRYWGMLCRWLQNHVNFGGAWVGNGGFNFNGVGGVSLPIAMGSDILFLWLCNWQ